MAALLLGSCAGDSDKSPVESGAHESGDTPAAADVCARPTVSTTPAMGDSNLDGVVDISDGVFALRALLHGGAPVGCESASDVIQDETLDLSDGFAIWYHLFAGNTVLPDELEGDCTTLATLPETACGALALGFDAPASSTGDFTATVQLSAPDLDLQAWSLAITASGCTITDAQASGVSLDTTAGGQRNKGYERTEVVDGAAISAVVLSWRHATTLAASSATQELLRLQIDATPPASDCAPCVLSFQDGLKGSGEAIDNLLTHEGRSYAPTLGTATIEVCAE